MPPVVMTAAPAADAATSAAPTLPSGTFEPIRDTRPLPRQPPSRGGADGSRGGRAGCAGGGAAARRQAVESSAVRRPLRALVVDDDPDIRMIVSATLRKMAVPMEVVQAADGFEALEKAREATPDLVVLDVMMPRMDGFETCRGLRAKVQTAFVPILMLTASADQDSRTKGYLIGTDDYMAKPFLPVDLKLRIARLLRSDVRDMRGWAASAA